MTIYGTVEAGKHLGRRLGFPTANLRPDAPCPALPPNGVYVAALWVENAPARACILNQGRHPTAPEGKPTIEAHVLDYDGDLYGKRVRLEYLRFLRSEKRFESLEALTAQLSHDREAARTWLSQCQAGEIDGPEASRVREIDWVE